MFYLMSLHTGTDLIVQRLVGIILVFWTGTSPHFSTILVVQVSSGTSLATFSITSEQEVFFSSRHIFSLMSPHSIVGIIVVTVFLKARVPRWIKPTLKAHLTSSQTCSVTSSQDSTGTVMSVHSILGIGWHCFWFTWREKINKKIPKYYMAPLGHKTIQHTTVHFFSMISFSTGLSTMLQTFFSLQDWTGMSWQVISGTWWQLSWQ